jgi:hypothetical protein
MSSELTPQHVLVDLFEELLVQNPEELTAIVIERLRDAGFVIVPADRGKHGWASTVSRARRDASLPVDAVAQTVTEVGIPATEQGRPALGAPLGECSQVDRTNQFQMLAKRRA